MWIQVLGGIAGGALFWLMYFDLKDSLEREPRRLLLWAFALGLVSAPLAFAGFRLLESVGIEIGVRPRSYLLYCVLIVGPLEEAAKFLVARALVFRWRHFDEPIDGLVYATAIAIGFASVENLIYLPQLDGWERWGRAIASPLTHSVWAAIWGLGCGHALVVARTRTARLAWQIGPLAAAMLLHGLYDAALLELQQPMIASALVLVLWIAIIARSRQLIRHASEKQATETPA